MDAIALREPELVTQVAAIVQSEGQSADDFVGDAVRIHIAHYRQKRIQAETEAWFQLTAAARQQYRDQFVAILDGKVVDSDSERLALFHRTREQFGMQPVAILDANDEAIQTYRVSSIKSA